MFLLVKLHIDMGLEAQGVIFREYSRQSKATTHYFPWKFWLVIEANIRQVSLVSRFVTVTE